MNKQCPTCPFLECNRGKPTPTDFKCVEVNETDWYTQENIDGIWQAMRTDPIIFLSCHTTDPDYYGSKGKPIYACLGAALAVYIHYKIFESVKNYNKYVEIVGKGVAMKQKAMGEKALAMMIGRTSAMWGNMILPTEVKLNLEEARWPTGFEKAVAYFKTLTQNV